MGLWDTIKGVADTATGGYGGDALQWGSDLIHNAAKTNRKDINDVTNYEQKRLDNYTAGLGSGVIGAGYAPDWRKLIAQLQGMASGQGPSLAAQQFKSANQAAIANQYALAHGGRGPQSAYQAQQNIGQLGQALSQGVTEARTREQMAAIEALRGAIGGADQADFSRSAANQNFLSQLLGMQTSLATNQVDALSRQKSNYENFMGWLTGVGKALGMGGGGGGA